MAVYLCVAATKEGGCLEEKKKKKKKSPKSVKVPLLSCVYVIPGETALLGGGKGKEGA